MIIWVLKKRGSKRIADCLIIRTFAVAFRLTNK